MDNKTKLLAAVIFVASLTIPAQAFLEEDIKSISQIQATTISTTNESYVIETEVIRDIDIYSISKIQVDSEKSSVTINIKQEKCLLFLTCGNITSLFLDKTTSYMENLTWTQYPSPIGAKSNLYIPFYDDPFFGEDYIIVRSRLVWVEGLDIGLGIAHELLNHDLMNSANTSMYHTIPLSKSSTITITGTDKVDINYVFNTPSKIHQTAALDPESTKKQEGALDWLLYQIPYVGDYLVKMKDLTYSFLDWSLFFIGFAFTNFDIVYMGFLSMALTHGIILMVFGTNPFSAVVAVIIDHISFIRFIIWVIVEIFGFVWRIVQAAGQAIRAIRPV